MINVVIVDDELHIVEGLKILVEHLDDSFKVISVFQDCEEALEWVKSNIPRIDCLISDINMPNMSGLQLIEEVHKIDQELPCVILTGYDKFEYAKTAISIGVLEFLLKPVDLNELKAVMEKVKQLKQKQNKDRQIEKNKYSAEVHCIINEIENNYCQFSMTKMADSLKLNREYLSRIFKQETGQTITDYLVDVRMRHARELLSIPGKYKVYEVCSLVGYEDNVYFSKLFKKKFKVTPKEFQKYYIQLNDQS